MHPGARAGLRLPTAAWLLAAEAAPARAVLSLMSASAPRRRAAGSRWLEPAPESAPRELPCGSPALLAQLVEHFHGKEGVAGSSPAEGFIGTPRYGGDFVSPAVLATAL